MKQPSLTDNEFVALSASARGTMLKVAEERHQAFLHGVGKFCKESSFDNDDCVALLSMLEKTSWWGNTLSSPPDTGSNVSTAPKSIGPNPVPAPAPAPIGSSNPASGFYTGDNDPNDPKWGDNFYNGFKKDFQFKVNHGMRPIVAADSLRMESGLGGMYDRLVADPEFAQHFGGKKIGTPEGTGPSMASGSTMPPAPAAPKSTGSAVPPAPPPPTPQAQPLPPNTSFTPTPPAPTDGGMTIGPRKNVTPPPSAPPPASPSAAARSAVQNATASVPGASTPPKNPNAGIYLDKNNTDSSLMDNFGASGGTLGDRGKVTLPKPGF